MSDQRERLTNLYTKRKEVYHVNGKGWLQLPARNGEARRVPAAYLEEWIKNAEIEIGLIEGRRAERRNAR